MEILKISAVGLITVFAVLSVRDTKPEIALTLSLTGGVIILLFILNRFFQVFDFFERIIQITGVDGQIVKSLLKMVGVGYFAEFSASIAEESGQKSLGEKIVLGGKVAILVLSFPIIETLVKIVSTLLL